MSHVASLYMYKIRLDKVIIIVHVIKNNVFKEIWVQCSRNN